MSADNWAICPNCKAEAEKAKEAQKRRATEAYGHVPIEEFDVLRAEADAEIDYERLRTFREDYEFYGADEGTVIAAYSGKCSKCGVGTKFEYERTFWTSAGGPVE